jgi:LPXTG-motif cell wall-anchored protein
MKTSTILILVGVALAAVGVWFFFIRKKPAAAVAGRPSTYSPGASVPQYPLAGGAPALRPPLQAPGGGKVTVGGALEQGVSLAATAGCAAAAAAYTGGAAMPLCGLAGPLAVGIGQGAVTGAKAIGGAVVSGAKALCFWC